ncbi:heavy metal translocating P-type ATPase [Desertibacillus haloalkaliphilus]|uniref:heavy metal translocating P-type ATPase n=1 Tax=Desertibacillus haloalkaliphilus TaxID=1328930 RepID=UPI001C26FABC|nr:heavy metal translocating P-type ATPase [Desertibacillus haloalkaliphilus]MBU8905844.1 cadmium-translocating P-type ATPase [Desertibacillus haloalkaliphilus]
MNCQHGQKPSFQYLELLFALGSGVLLLIAWIVSRFDFSTLSVLLYLAAYVIGGYYKAHEGLETLIHEKRLSVEVLMIIAAIGAALIGYWVEGAILIFIFSVSGALETYTMQKSEHEISSLMNLQPEEATVIKDDKEQTVAVAELVAGDHIIVKAGERIPADGVIVHGETTIDESTITGEPVPVAKEKHADVFAGTVNGKGLITVNVTKPSSETLFQKIITLVQSAKKEKSPSQQFIERFEGPYVKTVLIIVALMMFLPHYLFGWSWNETLYRAMVMLVVASPCALVASIMPATLSAISNGARNGILFKGGIHLENLAHIDAIALDKTGTLTNGTPEVTDVWLAESVKPQQFYQLVSSIESQSNHPLAESITAYANEQATFSLLQPDKVEDVTGWGIEATIDKYTYRIGKRDFINERDVKDFFPEQASELAKEGKTIVYVANGDGVLGLLALKDRVREVAVEAIASFKQAKIRTVMITGDHPQTARAIQAETKIDECIANCLPEAKVNEIKKLQHPDRKVAMVGDGINDAPALATANVGIAMGNGTDVAIDTADIVLMKNNLAKIAKAIQLSKRMNRIIKQNIVFSIAVIVLLLASNFMQQLSLPLGVIGHEGSTILVILNGLRLLRG